MHAFNELVRLIILLVKYFIQSQNRTEEWGGTDAFTCLNVLRPLSLYPTWQQHLPARLSDSRAAGQCEVIHFSQLFSCHLAKRLPFRVTRKRDRMSPT